jgi:cytochrome P450
MENRAMPLLDTLDTLDSLDTAAMQTTSKTLPIGEAVVATTSAPVYRQIKNLPGPRAWPLVGNALQVKVSRIHLDIEHWCQRYGPLFRVYLGRRPMLAVANHATVSDLLRDRPDGFRRPSVTAFISSELGGLPNIFMAEGTAWRNQRRMVMAGFAPKAIREYFPALVKVGLRLRKRWSEAAATHASIDLSADLKRYTVDVIAGLAFGQDVNTLESGDNVIQQHLDRILPGISRRSLSAVPYWRYFKLPQDRRLDESSAALRQEVYRLIDEARHRMQHNPDAGDKPANLLEALIAAADQPGSGMDNDSVAGNVSTMLLAGEDTTANSIAWLLYFLRSHPEALQRATQEVQALAPDCEAFTLEQLDSLDFLGACIEEAMRLKPVAPYLPLEALADTTVEDVHVPAGTIVWCVLRHDSVDEKSFTNAAAFDPARWLAASDVAEPAATASPVKKMNIDKSIAKPFGAGPRTCPGRYLALLEIKIAVAMVLGHFEIQSVATNSGQPPQELMGFVMSPEGLKMRLRAR